MITPQEKQTLEALVTEGQKGNLYQGAAALVLKWLGIGLFAHLTRRARERWVQGGWFPPQE